jgi:hypothetical protein
MKGSGVSGRTFASSNSAGVLGLDDSTREVAGTNDGVEGASGVGTGVLGKSIDGAGVEAETTGGSWALLAQNSGSAGYAIDAQASSYGTYSVTTHQSSAGTSAAGVAGLDASSDNGNLNFGVWGNSLTGTGVLGFSNQYVGVLAAGGGVGPAGIVPSLSVTGSPIGQPTDLIDACESIVDYPCASGSSSRALRLDNGGNLTISGLLYTAGSCSVGCSGLRVGVTHRVVSYAPTQTVPSIEDFGEAQLVDGHASVALSADLANVIDRAANYLVFITPDGDCDVLYVARKTATGFEVRESHGGRSTLAFDYRIVAKPFGAVRARLPMETLGPRVPGIPLPKARKM